jgi:hypothetical protein
MKKLTEIRRLFKKTESSNKPLAMKLIGEAEFMGAVLEELKIQIAEAEHDDSALRNYNAVLRNYQGVIKMLNDMIPDKVEEKIVDEFEL